MKTFCLVTFIDVRLTERPREALAACAFDFVPQVDTIRVM